MNTTEILTEITNNSQRRINNIAREFSVKQIKQVLDDYCKNSGQTTDTTNVSEFIYDKLGYYYLYDIKICLDLVLTAEIEVKSYSLSAANISLWLRTWTKIKFEIQNNFKQTPKSNHVGISMAEMNAAIEIAIQSGLVQYNGIESIIAYDFKMLTSSIGIDEIKQWLRTNKPFDYISTYIQLKINLKKI